MMDNAAAFDARYRADPDPWGYHHSEYERDKYAATLAACGTGPFLHALELGASIGVFSALLAPLCRRLTTVDFSEVAVRRAREHLRQLDHVEVRHAAVPWDLTGSGHDLVVASEILYYLSPAALEATMTWLATGLAPGGRLIVVHWRPEGSERPFTARQVHDRVIEQPWLAHRGTASTQAYLLDVLERRSPE